MTGLAGQPSKNGGFNEKTGIKSRKSEMEFKKWKK